MVRDEQRARQGGSAAPGEEAGDWFMPFIPGDEAAGGPTDESFGGRGAGRGGTYAASLPARDRQVSGFVALMGRLLMVGSLVVFLLAIGAGITGGGVTERATSSEEYALNGATSFTIDNTAGNVRVVTGPVDQVSIRAVTTVRHFSRSLAQEALGEAKPQITQTGGVVHIAAGNEEDWSFFLHRSVQIDVVVPANVSLTLDQRAGSMSVTGVSGKIVATVAAGSLDLEDVQLGDGSDIRVRAGSVRLDGALLPDAAVKVDVVAGNASLVLPFKTDARLDASAVTGNISVEGWPNTVTVSTPAKRSDTSSRSATGTLSSVTNPKGSLTIRVNTGNASLAAGDGRPPRTPFAPKVPSAPQPPLPPVPPARER